MNEKLSVQVENPVSQPVESVKALLSYLHRPVDPLPSFVELNGHVRLTLSKDKKAYYATTLQGCSCPARAFSPGRPCKHMLTLQASIAQEEEGDLLPERSQAFRPTSDDKVPRLETRPGAVVA